MTALLEIKQNIKKFYGQYEIYILPVLKFLLAFVYFLWINSNMGYMKQLDNIFVILILALVCSILPVSVMMFVGFALMIGHCDSFYADPFSEIQQFTESGHDPDTSFFWIQRTDASSYRSRTVRQCTIFPSGWMRRCDLLFYPFCSCTVSSIK